MSKIVDGIVKDIKSVPEKAKAASDRFYAIYDKINGNEGTGASVALCSTTKAICSALYTVYGDAAYSEMPLLTLQMLVKPVA